MICMLQLFKHYQTAETGLKKHNKEIYGIIYFNNPNPFEAKKAFAWYTVKFPIKLKFDDEIRNKYGATEVSFEVLNFTKPRMQDKTKLTLPLADEFS